MRKPCIALSLLLLSFAGCGSPMANVVEQQNREAERTGSPFRWEVKSAHGGTAITRVLVDLPSGASKADETLRKDILSQIRKQEAAQQRADAIVDRVGLLPDGREVWVLKHPTEGVAYIVSMTPAMAGGTDFGIDGPHLFHRKG